MPLIKFTDDPIVKRLRWLIIGAICFSMFNTLLGQPESFWQRPETAIRGDGLSIHNETNHTFELFLGRGWQAYLLACLVYCAAAFLAVSVLPRAAALIAIFLLFLAITLAHPIGWLFVGIWVWQAHLFTALC